MISFWETSSFQHYDVIVVGAGILGTLTALNLRALEPRSRIAVIERGTTPYGASTRNAGFACFGSASEILADIERGGEDHAAGLVALRWEGLQKLRQRVSDSDSGFEQCGGFEPLFVSTLPLRESIDRLNALLSPTLGCPPFQHRPDLLQQTGLNTSVVQDLIVNPLEGHLHSGNLMWTLHSMAMAQGIRFLFGVEVEGFVRQPECIITEIKGLLATSHLHSERLIFCTNATLGTLFPESGIVPGRGQVLVTKPLSGAIPRGTFHFDKGYFYFRDLGQRILFGGGRNLAFDAEQTTDMSTTDAIQNALEDHLRAWILCAPFEIEWRWSGLMAFTTDALPQIRNPNAGIFYAVSCNGMGVAISSTVAEKLAAMVHSNG